MTLDQLNYRKGKLRPVVFTAARRTMLGHSQEEIARHLQVSPSMVSDYVAEAERVLGCELPRRPKGAPLDHGRVWSPEAMARFERRKGIHADLPDREGVIVGRCSVCTLMLPHEGCIPDAAFFAAHRKDDAA